jgi:glycosyltransferase involved in cell wall biosynthesis
LASHQPLGGVSGEFTATDMPEHPVRMAFRKDDNTITPPCLGEVTPPGVSKKAAARGSLDRRAGVRRFLDRLSGQRRKHSATKHRDPIVALVTDAIFPYNCGGREIRYHELSRRLSGRAELHLFTMRWWGRPRVRKEETVTLHGISRLRPMYTKNRRSLKQAILFSLACMQLLGSRFDVLEADHMPLLPILVLRFVATVKRRRFVVTWHEVWGHSYWRQYLGRAGIVAWFVEYLAMRLPDHIIAASSQTAERLIARLGTSASITVAPNGIDLKAVRDTYPHPAGSDLVVVSRLMPHKRINMLLDAVALLHAEGIPVTCRIIGDGPDREQLWSQAQDLGVEHAVEFLHNIREQKEVYELLKAAKVFVFPSAREGFGIAVLEALACGLPVITTSAPDNLAQDLVARSSRGVICDSSAPAIADAVKRLLADRDASAGQASSAGRASDEDELWLAEYNWDVMVDRVMSALQI